MIVVGDFILFLPFRSFIVPVIFDVAGKLLRSLGVSIGKWPATLRPSLHEIILPVLGFWKLLQH